jgi:hypothetical protein
MRPLAVLTLLGLIIAMAGSSALADGYATVPVIPPCTPNWSPVPGVPGVHYAPNIQTDIFRYRSSYYCQYRGRWYQGRTIGGPWTALQAPPATFYRIEAPYFKMPPGWAKGKKAGWHGAYMPPGQMKKYGCGPDHIPPGQAKKMAPLTY